MYCEYYRLREKPFNVTPDPAFFYYSKRHKEAFTHLLYGIKERQGFLQITGEIGTGKTTLCRVLLSQLDEHTKSAFIFNPTLSQTQLLQGIVRDLGIQPVPNNNSLLLTSLNEFLIRQLSLNNNVLVILDEAQALRPSSLEQVRLLSNLETEKEKLIQIVLVGQQELRDKLDQPRLRQLKQRITLRYHILPLDREEVSSYIKHRLEVAGSAGDIVFDESAIEKIYEYSKGLPRVINIVCDKALLLGYVKETCKISGDIIEKSFDEIEGRVPEEVAVE